MWLRDYHFDGLRLDAVHGIFDTSAEPCLEQLGNEVRHLEAQLGNRTRTLVLIHTRKRFEWDPAFALVA